MKLAFVQCTIIETNLIANGHGHHLNSVQVVLIPELLVETRYSFGGESLTLLLIVAGHNLNSLRGESPSFLRDSLRN